MDLAFATSRFATAADSASVELFAAALIFPTVEVLTAAAAGLAVEVVKATISRSPFFLSTILRAWSSNLLRIDVMLGADDGDDWQVEATFSDELPEDMPFSATVLFAAAIDGDEVGVREESTVTENEPIKGAPSSAEADDVAAEWDAAAIADVAAEWDPRADVAEEWDPRADVAATVDDGESEARSVARSEARSVANAVVTDFLLRFGVELELFFFETTLVFGI